jgi:hypothetical protein
MVKSCEFNHFAIHHSANCYLCDSVPRFETSPPLQSRVSAEEQNPYLEGTRSGFFCPLMSLEFGAQLSPKVKARRRLPNASENRSRNARPTTSWPGELTVKPKRSEDRLPSSTQRRVTPRRDRRANDGGSCRYGALHFPLGFPCAGSNFHDRILVPRHPACGSFSVELAGGGEKNGVTV